MYYYIWHVSFLEILRKDSCWSLKSVSYKLETWDRWIHSVEKLHQELDPVLRKWIFGALLWYFFIIFIIAMFAKTQWIFFNYQNLMKMRGTFFIPVLQIVLDGLGWSFAIQYSGRGLEFPIFLKADKIRWLNFLLDIYHDFDIRIFDRDLLPCWILYASGSFFCSKTAAKLCFLTINFTRVTVWIPL